MPVTYMMLMNKYTTTLGFKNAHKLSTEYDADKNSWMTTLLLNITIHN
jgi:hypothetical protein